MNTPQVGTRVYNATSPQVAKYKRVAKRLAKSNPSSQELQAELALRAKGKKGEGVIGQAYIVDLSEMAKKALAELTANNIV